MNTRPLSKDFYSFITFFLSILCIISLVQALALLQMGSMITGLSSFDSWMWLVLAVIGITNAAMVRYLLRQGYRLAALVCVFSCLSVFVQYILILVRSLRGHFLENFHLISALIFATAVIWGLSLLRIRSYDNRWLQRGGMLTVVLALSSAVVYYFYFQTGEGGTKLLLDKINRWISLAGVLSPVCILKHFYEENKRLAVPDNAPARTFPALLKLGAFIGMLFLGFNFSVEAFARSRPYKPSVTEVRRSKLVESHHFIDKTGDSLYYRLLKPVDYDSTQLYPLIVCLHHGGSHGKDNIQQLSADPAPFLMEQGNRTKYPSFIFMPQSPMGLAFSGAYGAASVDSLVFRTIRRLQGRLPIDPKRIYVMGISGGGYGSWHFISMHPELFAAAVPICGGGDPQYGRRLVHVPVWAFHGARDKLAPVAHSRDMIEAIRKAGGKPKYTEYEFAGHGIWDKVSQEGVLEWMFAQHKP